MFYAGGAEFYVFFGDGACEFTEVLPQPRWAVFTFSCENEVEDEAVVVGDFLFVIDALDPLDM